MQTRVELVCEGCGHRLTEGAPPSFRCPRARPGDDVSHVLRRVLRPGDDAEELAKALAWPQERPFEAFRSLLGSYRRFRQEGSDEGRFVERIRRLDESVRELEGRGFCATPWRSASELAQEIGLGSLWIKDETGQVGGSHKARHFLGLMLWLEDLREQGAEERLAIASCGNAALGAALVARAAERKLRVFVPPWVHPVVAARLRELDAESIVCERRSSDPPGDPSFLRFREAVAGGDLPFTCQGAENALVIEGGQTLVWEIVSELAGGQETPDRFFVQVGGGALGTACVQGWEEARALGALPGAGPAWHFVQTSSAWPLRRAWRRVVDRVLAKLGEDPASADPSAALEVSRAPADWVEEALTFAARHRSHFMWPWEEEPRSIASGILDDETYDWLPLVRAMVESGGWPIVVGEEVLAEARRLGQERVGIPADATGTAGLAGCLEAKRRGEIASGDRVALLFTGVEREERKME